MAASVGSCAPAVGFADVCASNSGTQVDVSGTQSSGGSSSSGSKGTPPPSPPREQCTEDLCRDSYEVVMLPDVTTADLVSFVPARPRLSGEPRGAAIVGMPANIVASAAEQRIPGTLFDYDVVVRFVPSAFRFAYGDGSVRTTSTGGSSWAAQHQADFTPTATSHRYAKRGVYEASVTVLYSAAVDFGGGWRPVPGYVEATASGYRVHAVEVRTALVANTCLENPRGPGC
jgi:hypothetical protein